MRPGGIKAITAASPAQFSDLGNQNSVAWVGVINDSPFTVLASFGNGAADYIPAYQTKYYATADLGFSWAGTVTVSVASIPANVSNAPASDIGIALYSPGEQVQAATATISRSLVSVADITAQFLSGDGQTLSLTEVDDGFGNAMLAPLPTVSAELILAARDGSANAIALLDLNPRSGSNEATLFSNDGSASGLGNMSLDTVLLEGSVARIGLTFTVGKFGVAAVVKDSGIIAVTTTGLKNITSLTAPASATPQLVRVSFTARLQNGTTPQNYTAQITYTDGFTNASRTQVMLIQQLNGVTALANGASGILATNNIISGVGYPLTIQAASTVTVQFNDPLNTPNDLVRAIIEILA